MAGSRSQRFDFLHLKDGLFGCQNKFQSNAKIIKNKNYF